MNSEGFLVREKSRFRESDVAEKSPCGHYVRYKKILGRGAFKDVYKGFDLVDNVEIAWNQICLDDETTLKSQESQEKLFSEAVLLKSLNHRNIMKCYSFWLDYDNKTVNMITELFSSGSLWQYVKKLGGADVHTIKNWGRQILHGLQYLHSQNPCIIHRDLKCDNMFIDVSKGEIKIGDFGLATVMQQSPLQDLAGTPEFMAPEYYEEEYNELVDIYAFGMCLMELATCEHPYSECTNQAQIFKKVSSGIKPAALGKVNNPEVKEIIEKCLLPASLRPSAMELLKDPFFSTEISMEIEHEAVKHPFFSTGVSMETEHNCSQDSSLTIAHEYSEDQYLRLRSCNMDDDLVLSGISALYNSMSWTDANRCKLQSSCYHSSVGDASMNSKITFASSKDLCFSVPKLFLSGNYKPSSK